MRPRPGILLAATVLLVAPLCAQQPSFRGGVDLVQVDLSVTRGGRPVPNLAAGNFAVTDNGEQQDATLTSRGDLPLRVTLLLDTSGSVQGRRLQRLVEAGGALVERLHPDDQVSLVTFSSDVRQLVPMAHRGPRIGEALAELTAGGTTALFDALHLALAAESTQQVRSLVLVFSDGRDSSSWSTYESAIDIARRSSSVVHIVRFGRDEITDHLAEAAGGRTFGAGSDDDLRRLFTQALDEMRARYLLTYSLATGRTKGWHEIKVRLNEARGDVAARPGYFVP